MRRGPCLAAGAAAVGREPPGVVHSLGRNAGPRVYAPTRAVPDHAVAKSTSTS